MAKKPFKQQWEETDFVLIFKIALRDFWRELQCSWQGLPFQKTTQEEYLELLNAKRNSKN